MSPPGGRFSRERRAERRSAPGPAPLVPTHLIAAQPLCSALLVRRKSRRFEERDLRYKEHTISSHTTCKGRGQNARAASEIDLRQGVGEIS